MKKSILLLVVLQAFILKAQFIHLPTPPPALQNQGPEWARMMYNNSASVAAIDALYNQWRGQNAAVKDFHTQYYKRWRRMAALCTDSAGYFNILQQRAYYAGDLPVAANGMRSGAGNWSPVGPMQTYRPDGTKENDQTNVYSITQCAADPSVMYCGTEPGEIYKSTNGGETWMPSSTNYFFNGVEAIAVHPDNPDIVFAGNGYNLMRSTDGGVTWNSVLYDVDLWPHEILIHPIFSDVIIVAGNSGLFRSADGGTTWIEVSSRTGWDVKAKPGSDNVIYSLQSNGERSEFYMSTDLGSTWTLKDNGWFEGPEPEGYDGGSRLAVTAADTNRIYTYLIGDAKYEDFGYIGVYRSDDGGENWYLPNGPAGGPFTDTHMNLAIGWVGWNYHQGFYNCALAASPDSADHILVGGLNLYKSTDGGFTFFPVAGYVGGYLPIHVDMQDFRVTETGTWITNDVGITYSDNFYASSFDIKMQGLHGSDYWGFGTGWNHDVHVGGLYHNGNLAWYTNYGEGNFMQLGGAEPPSGYVNPGNNFKVYSSELGVVTIPQDFGETLQYGGLGLAPNESYWAASSSEMEFHPACYNEVYVGRDNKLWKSDDGGASFNLLYTFPGAASAEVRYFEITRTNPNVIYVSQAASVWSGNGRLWKSEDAGVTFSELSLPGSGGGRDRILLAVDFEDENAIYLAYPGAAAANKVFYSSNAGASWENISGSVFDGHEIRSMIFTSATNGGIYIGTNYDVFYRDNSMDDWTVFDNGLPYYANANIIRPFYRDAKLRMATYGKGVWESAMEIAPLYPIAQPMVDKWSALCSNEAFYFEDHSVIVHEGASWSWTFEGGTPATSSLRNPIVYFESPGFHIAELTVADAAGNSSTASLQVEVRTISGTTIAETFEGVFPPFEWTTQGLNAGVSIWNKTDMVGGYGSSSSCAMADNYWNDLQGGYGDLRAFVNLSSAFDNSLSFDVAYTPYGFPYSDTLVVMVSTDCGESFMELFRQGGMDLATAEPYTADTFIPEDDEWQTHTIALDAFEGMDNVMVAFRNIGYWGQAMYIDNVNLNGTLLYFPEFPTAQDASLTPNLLKAGESLHVMAAVPDAFTLTLYNTAGHVVQRIEIMSGNYFQTDGLAAGTYVYLLESESYMRTGKLVVL